MNMNEIEAKTRKCLNNIGIVIDEDNKFQPFKELIKDSITFVSFVIELEQAFETEIPDDFLLIDSFEYIDDVYNLISILTEQEI